MPSCWSGISDGEPWEVEIEVDRFTDREPSVVSIFTRHTDADDGESETLACPDPDQARAIAAALVAYAEMCERANARVSASAGMREGSDDAR